MTKWADAIGNSYPTSFFPTPPAELSASELPVVLVGKCESELSPEESYDFVRPILWREGESESESESFVPAWWRESSVHCGSVLESTRRCPGILGGFVYRIDYFLPCASIECDDKQKGLASSRDF